MKYVKPRSVTWWSGVALLGGGGFIAGEPIHGLAEWVDVAQAVYGGMPPGVMINSGFALIGLRGAMA